MPILKTCQQCSKEFATPARRSETVKFCSRECKTKAGWIVVGCAACGTDFLRKKSDQARSNKPYCSPECYHAGTKGKQHAVKSDAVRYFKTCDCGTEFRVTLTRKDTARWCSRECQSLSATFRKEMSVAQAGQKSWRWAGGLYRNHNGYVRQRAAVGVPAVDLEHRAVITREMLKAEPDHPFLVEVNGEKKLSREIEVHHIDRDRANNKFSNLLAVTKQAHAQIHHRNSKPKPWECWPRDPTKW